MNNFYIKNFDDFFKGQTRVNESAKPLFCKNSDCFTVVCVSVNGSNSYEIQYLKRACEIHNSRFILADFTKKENFVKIIDGECVLCVGNVMYNLDKTKTIIVKRHAHMSNPLVSKNIDILVNNNFLIVNSKQSNSLCRDKEKTIKKLETDNISCPKYIVLNNENIGDFDKIISKLDVDFPVIAKIANGTQGNGVFMFDSPNSLKGVSQYILSHKEILGCGNIIVQELIKSDYDLRLHVLRTESDSTIRNGDNYTVFAAMKRKKLSNDYRSNVSLGSEYEMYEPESDEIELAKKAAKSVGCIWCGVDIMKDSETGKLYVIEINSTPSLKGISNVAKKDPATEFVGMLKQAFGIFDVETTKKEKQALGYKETFYINDFEKPLIALLDTGNGSLTSLRADDISVNKKEGFVEWTLFGKRFKTKYDGDVSYMSSSGNRVHQPTTRVDITHNGVKYENVRIKLSSITGHKHKDKRVLNINRDLMSKMNIVIDSSKKHVNQ